MNVPHHLDSHPAALSRVLERRLLHRSDPGASITDNLGRRDRLAEVRTVGAEVVHVGFADGDVHTCPR